MTKSLPRPSTRKRGIHAPPRSRPPSEGKNLQGTASPPSSGPDHALDIDSNRRLLNRYRFMLHEEMRILAGWLPKISTFELKCEMGRAIWENATHVNAFYLRLREIQSPA